MMMHFFLDMDTSGEALGEILSHMQDDKECVIEYLKSALTKEEQQ